MSSIDELAGSILQKGVGADEAINPFWREQLGKFAKALKREDIRSPRALFSLGYYELELPEGVANRDTPEWAKVASATTSPAGELSRGETEHAGAIAVLQRHGLLDDYLATIDRLRIASSMAMARHFFYLRRLQRVGLQPGKVLEIGAGGGHFARLMADAGMATHYVVVDLPEMLLNSHGTISHRVPQARLHVGEAPDFEAAGLHFWFLRTTDIKLVPDASLDLALNFNSFMEMDGDIRDFYFGEIYRTCRSGAVFYNVNRMQRGMTRRDGAKFENNPLLYPYRPTDRIIEWQPDEMQQCIRASRFQAPISSFSISRIALLA